MSDKFGESQKSGGAGGGANEAGSVFRSRIAAWLIAHALIGRHVEPIDLPAGMDVPTGTLLLESDAAVDDIEAELTGGARLYVQAKHSLTLSRDPESEFGKTARQLCAQVKRTGFDSSRMRLGIVVGHATGPLRALQRVLLRRHRHIAVAPTKEEVDVLATIDSHFQGLSSKEVESLLDATVVVLLDLDTPESPHREGCIAQLGQVVEGNAGELAWQLLELKSRNLAAQRFGASLDDWLDALVRGGARPRVDRALPGPSRYATLVAVERYKAALVAAGRRLSLNALYAQTSGLEVEPNTFEVPVGDTKEHVGLSWMVRRRRRLLLLGLPGIGKSTALRRLAAENASLSVGPLPLRVFLPQFGDALDAGKNPLETLVEVGVTHVRGDDRAAVQAELLRQLRNGGRAILILDALDECRGRRHAVVEAIQYALLELHDDVEVVVATRDAAYASAAVLGFEEATLQLPSDLMRTMASLATQLAESRRILLSERQAWVDSVLQTVRALRNDRGSFRQTALAATGMMFLAAKEGKLAGARGRAAAQSALVDWIAREWEIGERRRGEVEVSGQLSPPEALDFLTDVFDVIAYQFQEAESLPRSSLAENVADWAGRVWCLPRARARSAASAALDFWDDAGVFVASGADERIHVREAALRDLGVARWLAHGATDLERTAWLDTHFDDSDHVESLHLLIGLHPQSAAALVVRAEASATPELAIMVGRAVVEGPRGDAKTWAPIVGQLVGVLSKHVARGGRIGWKAFEAMLELPLAPADAAQVLSTLPQTFESKRAEVATTLGRLQWTDDVDLGACLRVFAAGPPSSLPPDPRKAQPSLLDSLAADPAYGRLAVALANRATPEDVDLVHALVNEGRMPSIAHAEVLVILGRRGCADVVTSVEAPAAREVRSMGGDMLRRSVSVHRNLVRYAGMLGQGTLTYSERRRMVELVDFLHTALPMETLLPDFQPVLLEHEALSRATLSVAADLGGFKRSTVGALVSVLHDEGIMPSGDFDERFAWLTFEPRSRELSHWPEPGADETGMLASVVALFLGTQWTASVASRALIRHPFPERATKALDDVFPRIENLRVRSHAAETLLSVDPERVKRAREWVVGSDANCVRAAAVALAIFYEDGQVGVSDLAHPLLNTDEPTRSAVRDTLRGSAESTELSALLEKSEAIPPDDWRCLFCGATNAPRRRDCAACHAAR